MNWGTRIFIVLAGFIVLAVSVGLFMVMRNTDTLETGDYYEEGLMYDDIYTGKQNVQRDKVMPIIQIDNDTLTIEFMNSRNRGQLQFVRPSDHNQDIQMQLYTAEGKVFRMPLNTFSRGAWKLLVRWNANDVSYYHEADLFIQE